MDDFELINNEICVSTIKYPELTRRMAEYSVSMASLMNGYNFCYNKGNSKIDFQVYFKDIKANLENVFGNEPDFSESLVDLKMLLSSNFIFEFNFDKGEKYLESLKMKMSYYCQIKMMTMKYTFESIVFFIFILLTFVIVFIQIKKINEMKIINNIYKNILKKLRNSNKVKIIRYLLGKL